MNRLLLLKKFDIIKKIYQKIIDDKINYYIKQYINTLNLIELKNLIVNAINENFKGEYLKEKLQTEDGLKKTFFAINDKTKLDKIIYFFLNNTQLDQILSPTDDELTVIKNTIYNEIKYNYIVNGFEGIYINENIMGIVKYLKGLSLDKGEVSNEGKLREDMAQKTTLGFAFQQKIARMLLASNMVYTVKLSKNADVTEQKTNVNYSNLPEDYTTLKTSNLKDLIELENLNKKKIKVDKKIKEIQEEESTKPVKIVDLYKFNKILQLLSNKNITYNQIVPDKFKDDDLIITSFKKYFNKLISESINKLITFFIGMLELQITSQPTVNNIIEKINLEFNKDINNKNKFNLINKLYTEKEDVENKISVLIGINEQKKNVYEAMNEYPYRVYDILFENSK